MTEKADDPVERARQALWLARKSLDDTPAGGTIAPQLRGVYHHADLAHSAITTTGDLAAALQDARNARAKLSGSTIDVEALERWLGTHDGGETIDGFVRQVLADLDEAVDALAAVNNDETR